MAKKENKEIKKAMDMIDEMSMDEKEWELYMSRKIAIMDYNSGMRYAKERGIEQGRQEGKKEKQIEIAKKLFHKNVSIEEIEEITELTKEEIKEIIK